MVPEKGRNAYTALTHELDGEPLHAEWLRSIIDDRGKRAAKTGVGFEAVREQVAFLNDVSTTDSGSTLRLGFRDYGRLKPRPVFEAAELTSRRIEGYESPSDAWRGGATRFYAGYDEILEELLREDRTLSLSDGFAGTIESRLGEFGYELTDELGSEVTWAAMARDGELPERPDIVLVPEAFRLLGTQLAGMAFADIGRIETYGEYTRATEGISFDDEEQVLADAPSGVAGIYMYVSGSTAESFGLAVQPIDGAISRLGIFETTQTTPMTEITSLKGFYDRYPDEFSSWRQVIDVVESTAKEFGFREVNTPAVERTELYRVKSGEELLDQTYTFEDRGGREVTLTPEQTPTRARMVQAKRQALSTPIKWYDTSKRWRYENVQKGRDREFFQTDIDIFGVESVSADAEVIACAARIYQKLDVDDRVDFLVNDRRLLEAMLEANGIENTTQVMQVVDDKEKLSQTEFRDALANVGVEGEAAENVDELTSISGPITETVSELAEKAPDDEETEDAIERMQSLADRLEAYDVAEMCKLDLSIVRGLAYYTGLVFEAFDTEGELRALFGGGRYDDLVGLFGSREVPAVGFAFGYSPTRELLKREGKLPPEELTTDAYIAAVSESVQEEGIDIAGSLRSAGLTVETDLSNRGLGDQLSYADSIGASLTLIVGERDLANDEVTVRNMDSGDEEQVPLETLTEAVRERLDE
jgi:histidyl-tRNA synthetase